MKLADAFGLPGYRTTSKDDFAAAFKKAYDSGKPALIEVLIDKDEFVLPMLPPGGSMDQIITEVQV